MVTHYAIGKANNGVQRKIPFETLLNILLTRHKAQVKNYIFIFKTS